MISVFSQAAAGLTLAEVVASADTIKPLMFADIERLGGQSVTRHCWDPTIRSTIDIGESSFNVNNAQLFIDLVEPRMTEFIDERDDNNALHLSLALAAPL